MKVSRYSLVLAFTLGFTAMGCGPTINKKLNGQNRLLFEAPAGETVHPGEPPYTHRPWQAGQWATYAIRHKKVWSTQKISVVGSEGGFFWLEMETVDPQSDKSPSWVKIQIAGYDPDNPESIRDMQVGETYVMTEAGGQVSNAVMPFGMGNPWTWIIEGMKLSVQEGPLEDASSVAGVFPQSKKIESQLKLSGFTSDTTAWFHSAVPVWGYVMQASKDGTYESKLLDFGYEGAESVVNHTNAINPFGG